MMNQSNEIELDTGRFVRRPASVLLSVLAIALAVGTESSWGKAQPLVIRTLDLRNEPLHEVRLGSDDDSLSISEIVVGSQTTGGSPSRLVISGCGTLGCKNNEDDHADIQIGAISSPGSAVSPSLTIVFRDIRLGSVTLSGGQGHDLKIAPTVSVVFEDSATASDIELKNATFRELKVRMGHDSRAQGSSTPADFRLTSASFESLVLIGETQATPVSIRVDAQPVPPRTGQGPSTILLSGLRILKGSLNLGALSERITSQTSGGRRTSEQSCIGDAHRLSVRLENAAIGELDPEYLKGGKRGLVELRTPRGSCAELQITDLKAFGSLVLIGDVIGSLSVEGFDAPSRRGDNFQIDAQVLASLRVASAAFDNVLISTNSQGQLDHPTEIPIWGVITATGVVGLPSQVFDGLRDILLSDPPTQSIAQHGVRTFLVETRWRGYVSDTGQQQLAAGRSLYSVLLSDSRRIYGPVGSIFLDWLTGFGFELKKPTSVAATLIILAFVPLFRFGRSIPVWDRFRWFSTMLLTGENPIASKLPQGWLPTARFLRLFLLVQGHLFCCLFKTLYCWEVD